jgi:DNA replication protein DnaC
MTEPVPLSETLARLEARSREKAGELNLPAGAVVQQIERGNVPVRFAHAALEDFTGEPHDMVRAWLAVAGGFMISGPVGTGKTHLAIAAARASEKQFLFFPVVEVLDAMRPGGDGSITPARLAAVSVLVLDDLGAEKASDWTADRLYAIVNRRWLECKPTIVTTNLLLGTPSTSGDEGYLIGAVGERLYSRLADGSIGLRLSGADRRRA